MTITSSSGLSDKDIVVDDAKQFAEANNGVFRLHVVVLGMPMRRLEASNEQRRRLSAQTQPGHAKQWRYISSHLYIIVTLMYYN